MKSVKQIVNEWYETIDNIDEFLDFAEGLNINEFVVEDGVRTIWLEDGMYYIAHGECIRETDGEKAREIINTLRECGIEFKDNDSSGSSEA
jgi:hypothetical protein